MRVIRGDDLEIPIDEIRIRGCDVRVDPPRKLVLRGILGAPRGPALERGTQPGEVAGDIVEDAEMDACDTTRHTRVHLVDRAIPRLEVDLGRCEGRKHERPTRQADASDVTGVEGPGSIEVGNVMRRMTRAREAREPEHVVADDRDVLLRNREQAAPQPIERIPVETACAHLEPGGVDDVWRAELGDVHTDVRLLADDPSDSTCVVEVNVREEDMSDVGERQAALGESSSKHRQRGKRPAVEEGEPVVGLDEVRRNLLGATDVVQVEKAISDTVR